MMITPTAYTKDEDVRKVSFDVVKEKGHRHRMFHFNEDRGECPVRVICLTLSNNSHIPADYDCAYCHLDQFGVSV